MEPTGPRAFQLVLLRRMADYQPQLVDEARSELGASRTEMREANRRWQAMLRSARAPSGLQRFRLVLGPAQSAGRRPFGDLDCAWHRWPVPLWPQLRYQVVSVAGGRVLHEGLVRGADASAPRLRTVGDLAPWTCVVEDVARAFPGAAPMEGTAPSRRRLAFTAPDASGGRGRYVADFTWGLLQCAAAAPPVAGEAAR